MHSKENYPGTLGLTLIEVIVVLGILAILAGMSATNLGDFIPDYQLRQAAQDLHSNMHLAKMEAIKRNADVKIVFDVSSSKYAVSLDKGTDNDWQTIADNTNLKVVKLGEYSDQVSYGIGDAQFKGTHDVVSYDPDRASFGPAGTCGSGYTYLSNSKGNAFAVGTLTSGVIILSKWRDGEWRE